jgi:hypothetical protein
VQEVTAPSKTAKTRGTVLRKANQGAIRATKSAIKLQGEVDSFNRRFRVGDPVDYLEVIEEGKAERLTVASPAYIMGGHTAVVHLMGKAGCVACSHCFMPPGVGG